MSDNDPDDLVGERRFTLPINPDPVTRRLQAERNLPKVTIEFQHRDLPSDIEPHTPEPNVKGVRGKYQNCTVCGQPLVRVEHRDISSDPVDGTHPDAIEAGYILDGAFAYPSSTPTNGYGAHILEHLPEPSRSNVIAALVGEDARDTSSDPVDVREAAQAYLDAPGEGSVKRDAEARLRQALSRDISSVIGNEPPAGLDENVIAYIKTLRQAAHDNGWLEGYDAAKREAVEPWREALADLYERALVVIAEDEDANWMKSAMHEARALLEGKIDE